MAHSWQSLFVLQGRAKHNPSTFLVGLWLGNTDRSIDLMSAVQR